MTKRSKHTNDNQNSRFKAAAKGAGASDDPADFDRILGGIAKGPPPETIQDRKLSKAKKPAK